MKFSSVFCLVLPVLSLSGDIVPGQFIVRFKPTVSSTDAAIASFLNDATVATKLSAGHEIIHKYDLNTFKGFAFKTKDLKTVWDSFKSGDVVHVVPDRYVEAFDTEEDAPWGISRIDQRDLPAGSQYEYKYTGEGVDSYVIDTGIFTDHPEFGGRAVWGADFTGEGKFDGQGHGTHVAGTVGSTKYGVAKKTNIIAVRVLNSAGRGSNSGVISGVVWAAKDAASKRQGKALKAVANMSLGGSKSSDLDDAINAAVGEGLVIVAAAGNSGRSACLKSPGGVPAAITVGATDINDKIASFSEKGSCIDIFAPGVDIDSTTNDGKHALNTGTSMASPHVAGAVALLLEAKDFTTVAEVHDYIKGVSSKSKVNGRLWGSPNNFLFTGF